VLKHRRTEFQYLLNLSGSKQGTVNKENSLQIFQRYT